MSTEREERCKMRFRWSRLCNEVGMSRSKKVRMMYQIAEGKTNEEREEIATQLIEEIQSGKYSKE